MFLHRIRLFIVSVTLFAVTAAGFMMLTPQSAHAACVGGGGRLPETVFVPWYKYLDCDASGAPRIDNWGKAIPLIGMAIIEMLIRIAGVIAVAFIVWGGIQYTTSQGEPEGINHAKSTISNAVAGLVVVFIAIGLVQFIAGLIK